jgi:hypothetical protein
MEIFREECEIDRFLQNLFNLERHVFCIFDAFRHRKREELKSVSQFNLN